MNYTNAGVKAVYQQCPYNKIIIVIVANVQSGIVGSGIP
jgi:hypothetical protein